MRKTTFVVGLLGAASLIGVAIAQTISVPTVTNIGSTDLIQVLPGGNPRVGNQYANPKQITAQYGYYKSSPATGFTYTFAANVTKAVFTPSTTLSTGSITLTAAPNDGQQDCFWSKNIVTTLTVSANTGQSINDAVTTVGAAGHACYVYSQSDATWGRSE
jgi:hypothetical protein